MKYIEICKKFNLEDLRNSDLSGANLSGANLRWANLKETDLTGVNFKVVHKT